MKIRSLLSLLCLLVVSSVSWSQQCDPTVPLYQIDLSANSDTTWILYEEDAQDRQGQCCNADPNENCIQFEIILNENTAGVFFDYDGAGAYGSLNWQIDCGPEYNLKDTICFNGGDTVLLTFCKPGSDNGNYFLVSVPKPTFPEDQFVPMNCQRPVEVLGVTQTTIQWQSITGGTPGQYDYLLSCTNCLDPIYTPDPNGPTEVEFQVCGYPILDYCLGNFDFCDTVKFTNLDSILLNVTPSNPGFCTGSTVDVTAMATGGDGNFTYYWYDSALNPIDTGAVLTTGVAGSYTVEVRDGNYDPMYCDNFIQTVVVVETSPTTMNIGGDQLLCADDPESELIVSYDNTPNVTWSTTGTGTFTPGFNDTNVIYTPSQADIASGNVTLTLTAVPYGTCPVVYESVQMIYVDTIQTDLSDMMFSCFGSIQTITPTVTGGTGNYIYTWSDGTSTLSNDLGIGTHCLTVKDDNGCITSECFTINSPPELNISTSSTPATTDGGSDGSVSANISGGTAPYSYSWSTGGTNQTETGLSYGIYTVTVTDANGCSKTASVVVNEPQCGGFSITTVSSDVSCFGESTGQATVNVSGGTPTYSYAWNDNSSQSTATATNLPTGVYEVVVTDGNGCLAVSTASIFQPSQLLNSMMHTDVSVLGGNDGSAQANITGGTTPYTYQWSTTESTSSINTLTAGWYQLEVTDNKGCVLQDSVLINEPPCDQFYLFVTTVSPQCSGDLTGEAALSVQNGVGPYTIEWSTGEINVMNITGAAGGIHTVEVTDGQGCYSLLNFGIAEPSPLSIGLIPTPSTCNGYDNGTIDMSISGGTYPYYYYTWSNGATTEDQINLPPGSYTVTVADENGCEATASTSLTDPEPLTFTQVVTDVSCYKGSDGSIDITPSGGTLPYSFDWSNGETTEDLAGIDIGGYILNITDGNFCDLGDPVVIPVNQPDSLLIIGATTSAFCYGSEDGVVNISVTGGTEPYNYMWSNGATTEDLNGVMSDSYTVQVTDDHGCTLISIPFDVSQPDSFVVVLTSPTNENGDNIDLFGGNTGEIDATVLGGMGPFDYLWSNGSITEDQYQLAAGTYSVNVTDLNGCPAYASIVLVEPMMLELPSAFSPNDDNANDMYYIRGIEAYPDNRFIVLNRWGNVMFETESYNNDNNYWAGESNNGNQLPDGIYFVLLEIDGGDITRETYVHIKTH